MTLHFAECVHQKAGRRSFGVRLEGREVLTDHEPLKAGFATAEAIAFATRVEDGLLDIQLVRSVDNPLVSAIEIDRLE